MRLCRAHESATNSRISVAFVPARKISVRILRTAHYRFGNVKMCTWPWEIWVGLPCAVTWPATPGSFLEEGREVPGDEIVDCFDTIRRHSRDHLSEYGIASSCTARLLLSSCISGSPNLDTHEFGWNFQRFKEGINLVPRAREKALGTRLGRDRRKKMIFGTLTDSWYPRKSTPGC